MELNLQHYNFFCPVTGKRLLADGAQAQFSPAVIGLWVMEVMEDPVFLHDAIRPAWETWLTANKDADDPDFRDFLNSVDQPNWVAFQLTTGGALLPETVVVVIDMNCALPE